MANNLTVTYKGSTIHTASATGSATLETGGTWCEGDIGLSYTFEDGSSATIEATVPGVTADSVTATKSGTTLNLVYDSTDGVWKCNVPQAGTWTIQAFKNGVGSQTQTINVEFDYQVTLSFYGALNDTSWSDISAVADADAGDALWEIGDCKSIIVNGQVGGNNFPNWSSYVFIIGFNHNATYEGNHRIHFMFMKTALTGGRDGAICGAKYGTQVSATGWFSMESSATNANGWSGSQMRNNVCGQSLSSGTTLVRAFPSELRAVIKTVTKYTHNSGNTVDGASYVTATTDYVFLLAYYEVFGNTGQYMAHSSEANKQQQYAYFNAGNSPKRTRHDTTTAVYWWLRSPAVFSGQFTLVSTSGSGTRTDANYAYAFAPAFCV